MFMKTIIAMLLIFTAIIITGCEPAPTESEANSTNTPPASGPNSSGTNGTITNSVGSPNSGN